MVKFNSYCKFRSLFSIKRIKDDLFRYIKVVLKAKLLFLTAVSAIRYHNSNNNNINNDETNK
jgi:hypothetical protein